MKYCEKCDGEGVVVSSTTIEDDFCPCETCAGMGVVGVPQAIFLQIEPNLDEVTWCPDSIYDNDLEYQLVNSIDDPMRSHKCMKIAQVKNMGPNRAWWLGKLIEPILNHPEEKWCLHITTPYKSIVLGVNLGDMMALAVLAHIVHKNPINPNWLDSMEKLYRAEAKI